MQYCRLINVYNIEHYLLRYKNNLYWLIFASKCFHAAGQNGAQSIAFSVSASAAPLPPPSAVLRMNNIFTLW